MSLTPSTLAFTAALPRLLRRLQCRSERRCRKRAGGAHPNLVYHMTPPARDALRLERFEQLGAHGVDAVRHALQLYLRTRPRETPLTDAGAFAARSHLQILES